MGTRAPGAPFDTPNAVIRRQGHNELTLFFRPLPYLSTLLSKKVLEKRSPVSGIYKYGVLLRSGWVEKGATSRNGWAPSKQNLH